MNRTYKCIAAALFKGVVIAATLLVIFLLIKSGHWLIQSLDQYNGYSHLNDYYGISISPYIDVSEKGMQRLDDALVPFFKDTNESGGLLLSANSQILLYNDGAINKEELGIKDCCITVNEAYLKKYPIYDINGNSVEITGKRDENYLLVPVRYRAMEDELKKYYEENNTFLRYYADDLRTMDIDTANNQKHELIPVNIIYIADGQTYRIPNMEADGKLKGVIKDALVDVATNENVSAAQIPAYITNQDFLLKVDSPEQKEQINQVIKKTGLDAFLMHFAPVRKQYLTDLMGNIAFILLPLIIICVLLSLVYLLEKRIFKNLAWKTAIKYFIVSWVLALCILLFILSHHIGFILILAMAAILLLDLTAIKRLSRINQQGNP